MQIIQKVTPLRSAGMAIHWLHPKSKRPIGEGWSSAPVASLEDLKRTCTQGNNVGVRLGQPSCLVDGSFLHVLDIDIRVPELADEAWTAVERLFEGLNIRSFPTVRSGSGGESRHIYFTSDQPYYSRKLAVSEGKFRDADGRWRYEWEIDALGTGKQAAMPPSIHPDTGLPYTWEIPFPIDELELGVGPFIAAERVSKITTAQSETFEFETRPPLEFKPGQLEAELDELDDAHIDDYQDWVTIGAALNHQFGGSKEGYALWVKVSKRSTKFNEREMPAKWRSFGRNRRQPATLATIRQWVIDARTERMLAEFDDGDDFDEGTASGDISDDEIDDLLGGASGGASGGESDDDFDDLLGGAPASSVDSAIDPEWKSLLDFSEAGAIRPTLSNLSLIVCNDPRLVGLPQFNEFTNETVQRKLPGTKKAHRRNASKPTLQLEGRIWKVEDPLNGTLWSDSRDADIRRILESPKTQGGYGIKVSDRDLREAIGLAAHKHSFHPIREFLNGLSWDGKPRACGLFTRYLGAEDNQYHRDIARIMLVAAVARIYEPGHKFDFAVIIEGVQGKRKSTFIETLGKKWFAELDGDFHDHKQMIELMQGAWILEIPELSSFNRGDVRSIKAFISRHTDKARLAYARRAGKFPRQCIFIGSTNDSAYLKDDTGARRFLPVHTDVVEIDIAHLRLNVDQIWAEAVEMYRGMRAKQPHGTLPLYLQGEAQFIAQHMQESRRVESVEDGMLGQIEAWLDAPINDGGFDDVDSEGQPKFRDAVCLQQIWNEALCRDPKLYHNNAIPQQLGRVMDRISGWRKPGVSARKVIEGYGRQRVWVRSERKTQQVADSPADLC